MRPLGCSVTCSPRHRNGRYLAKQKVGRQLVRLCARIEINAELNRNTIRHIVGAARPCTVLRMILHGRPASVRHIATSVTSSLRETSTVSQLTRAKADRHADIAIVNVRPDIVEVVVLSVFLPTAIENSFCLQGMADDRFVVPRTIRRDPFSPHLISSKLLPRSHAVKIRHSTKLCVPWQRKECCGYSAPRLLSRASR
uniref:Uncharacterized protein n=1 Tax=Burkholderia sp. (strain CCGE1003) TaxID=640512 RepID=E1T4K1_BURSG